MWAQHCAIDLPEFARWQFHLRRRANTEVFGQTISSQCFMPLLCTSNTSGARTGSGLLRMKSTANSRRPSSWLLCSTMKPLTCCLDMKDHGKSSNNKAIVILLRGQSDKHTAGKAQRMSLRLLNTFRLNLCACNHGFPTCLL